MSLLLGPYRASQAPASWHSLLAGWVVVECAAVTGYSTCSMVAFTLRPTTWSGEHSEPETIYLIALL
jgi:hypothetical protein